MGAPSDKHNLARRYINRDIVIIQIRRFDFIYRPGFYQIGLERFGDKMAVE
jgi:hypothetical protein